LRAALADGADLTARDDNDATPLHHAVQAPYDATDPLPSPDVVRELLAAGADVHARDRNGVTPAGLAVVLNDTMPAAAVDRSVEILGLLVAHGARLDGPAGFMEGGSFAHHSCTDPAIYTFLLDHGAPTALADDSGNTPLHVTVHAARPRLVALLVRHGVDTGVVNHLGQTPLGVARHLSQHTDDQRRARSEIIAMLEAAGAPAHVDYPAVPGGPLPIDMAAVRRSAGHDLQRYLTQDYDSYQHFIDTALTVEGNLNVLSRFVVTGDVTVAGCLLDAGPDSRIAIGGDLRATGVQTDGELHVGGELAADVVYGYYNDFTLRADVIRGRLVIEDEHAVAADVEAELHLDMETYEQGYGEGVQERLRVVLVDEVFSDDMLDQDALFTLLCDGRSVFRLDA
jgi:hypothetical protein